MVAVFEPGVWPIIVGASGIVLRVKPHWHAVILAAAVVALPYREVIKREDTSPKGIIVVVSALTASLGCLASLAYTGRSYQEWIVNMA